MTWTTHRVCGCAHRRALLGAIVGPLACVSAAPIEQQLPLGPSITRSQEPDAGAIWGVADLHAHPAIHLAFGGRRAGVGLIWGTPGERSRWPADPPDQAPCDPQSHAPQAFSQINRLTRETVISELAGEQGIAHGPGGDIARSGVSAYESWPDGRDVFHNTMHIDSIRRAFEGGLRLMVASATDSTPLTVLLESELFGGPPALSRESDRRSAEAQLRYIREMAVRNAGWMEVVTTPEQAEAAIRANRLALVLGLELDSLSVDDILEFQARYGVVTATPVHIVDNMTAGAAAYNDVFNAGSALMSGLFGEPDRYMAVERDPSLSFRFGWPKRIEHLAGVALSIGDANVCSVQRLGYGLTSECSAPNAPSGCLLDRGTDLVDPSAGGMRNSLGLRDAEGIRRLLAHGVVVDVAHMSYRAAEETLAEAERCGAPVVDTHTGVRYTGEVGDAERTLAEAHARRIARLGGVIGLGTGGRFGPIDPVSGRGVHGPSLSRWGTPLATVQSDATEFTIDLQPPPQAPASGAPWRVMLTATGAHGCGGRAPPRLRLRAELADGSECSSPPIGVQPGTNLYELTLPRETCGEARGARSDLRSLHLDWHGPGACHDALGYVALSELRVTLNGELLSTPPAIRLDHEVRSSLPLARFDPPWQPHGPTAEGGSHRYVLLRARSGSVGLLATSRLRRGARITGSLVVRGAPGAPATPCGLIARPDLVQPLRFVLTPEGAWRPGNSLEALVDLGAPPSDGGAGVTLDQIRGVRLCVQQSPGPRVQWELDAVSVEPIDDPVALWHQEYLRASSALGSVQGRVALGTDANGLFRQIPVSNHEVHDGEEYGVNEETPRFTIRRQFRYGHTPIHFGVRGLAAYGMIPEFLAIVGRMDRAPDARCAGRQCAVPGLFRSAQGFIESWRRVRDRASSCALGAR